MRASTVEEWIAHPFWKTHVASENCFSKEQEDCYRGDKDAQARACGLASFYPIDALKEVAENEDTYAVEMGHA